MFSKPESVMMAERIKITDLTPAPTPQQRLNRITEEGMCTGCGLCQSVIGIDAIRIRKQHSGYLRPVALARLSHAQVDRVYQICPGINVSADQRRGGAQPDLVWGAAERYLMAWAGQPEVRFHASTGGVMTGLAQYLVASDEVDFVLHVRASQTEPAFGEPHLSVTDADVIAACGSRYGPAAPLLNLCQLLDRGQRFAFIGKPCDIAALNNYARFDSRVDHLVRYRLAIVCGGYLTPDSFNDFLERAGVSRSELQRIRYRGNGCPGPVEMENRQGQVFLRSYNDFWGEGEGNWSIPWRCKICPDGIGEGADLVAADSWPECQVDALTEHEDPGYNAVILRNSKGEQLMQRAVAAGYICQGQGLSARDMDAFQPHQVVKKQAGKARIEGMQDAGGLGIVCRGLRLDQAATLQDRDYAEQQRRGARQRFLNRSGAEAVPV